jgi:hypothetical protein
VLDDDVMLARRERKEPHELNGRIELGATRESLGKRVGPGGDEPVEAAISSGRHADRLALRQGDVLVENVLPDIGRNFERLSVVVPPEEHHQLLTPFNGVATGEHVRRQPEGNRGRYAFLRPVVELEEREIEIRFRFQRALGAGELPEIALEVSQEAFSLGQAAAAATPGRMRRRNWPV